MFKGGNKFMEFGYSKEQVLLREMYKKFAETEIKPLAEELDEEDIQERLHSLFEI